MFLFEAAFLFTSTFPPKHLLNPYSFPTNQNELTINYFLPFAGAACPGLGRLAPYLERL